MAFSIKQIKAILSSHNMPVDELDKAAEEICGRHTADLDSIKEERDSYKKDAETLATVQQELNDLKSKSGDTFEQKFKEMEKKYNDLVAENERKETNAKIQSAYRALLKDAGVSEKRLDSVLKVTDISNMKLDKDGKLEGAAELSKTIKTEWADFITKDGQEGANPASPPDGNPSNPGNTGRAKQLASAYFNNLYGTKEEK